MSFYNTRHVCNSLVVIDDDDDDDDDDDAVVASVRNDRTCQDDRQACAVLVRGCVGGNCLCQ